MSTGSKYLFGRLVEYQIKNDTLYRCEYGIFIYLEEVKEDEGD